MLEFLNQLETVVLVTKAIAWQLVFVVHFISMEYLRNHYFGANYLIKYIIFSLFLLKQVNYTGYQDHLSNLTHYYKNIRKIILVWDELS